MNDITLSMPRLGETMEEGVIVGWLVEAGQSFKRGDPILELESDKTVVEFPALGDGVIDHFIAGPGARVAVGAPVARARVAQASEWTELTYAPAMTDAAAEPAMTKGAAEPAAGPNILRMPRLGETMEDGVIVQWLVAEGQAYGRGEAILEIETDKTVAEVPALYDGVLVKILATAGERILIDAPIAEVEGEVEPFAREAMPAATTTVIAGQSATQGAIVTPRSEGDRLRATPLARRLARQSAMDLAQIIGSGRRGRIERADVEAALAGGPAASLGTGLALFDRAQGAIAYRSQGTAGGETYLLLHGFAGDHAAWGSLSAALVRAGGRVVTPDLPSHGDSRASARSFPELVAAMLDFAISVQGPLVLVGHSLGAAIAAEIAPKLGDKVTRMVLITPAGCGPRIGADFVHGMAEAQSAGEVSHLLRLLGAQGGAVSASALEQMADELARGRLKDLAAAIASPSGRQKIDVLRSLEKLTLPVTAIFGTQDRIVAASDAFNLPSAISCHFLATGHMPQWDASAEVAALIRKGA